MTEIGLTYEELCLLVEALGRSAARHESMARWNRGRAVVREHDHTASAMRLLRARLLAAVEDAA